MGKITEQTGKPAVNYINIISNHIPICCCPILQALCGTEVLIYFQVKALSRELFSWSCPARKEVFWMTSCL